MEIRHRSLCWLVYWWFEIILNILFDLDTFSRHMCTYTVVLVVEVDNESERPPSHRLCRDKRVLKCGLACRGNYGAELKSSEVLDVELEILKETKQN